MTVNISPVVTLSELDAVLLSVMYVLDDSKPAVALQV